MHTERGRPYFTGFGVAGGFGEAISRPEKPGGSDAARLVGTWLHTEFSNALLSIDKPTLVDYRKRLNLLQPELGDILYEVVRSNARQSAKLLLKQIPRNREVVAVWSEVRLAPAPSQAKHIEALNSEDIRQVVMRLTDSNDLPYESVAEVVYDAVARPEFGIRTDELESPEALIALARCRSLEAPEPFGERIGLGEMSAVLKKVRPEDVERSAELRLMRGLVELRTHYFIDVDQSSPKLWEQMVTLSEEFRQSVLAPNVRTDFIIFSINPRHPDYARLSGLTKAVTALVKRHDTASSGTRSLFNLQSMSIGELGLLREFTEEVRSGNITLLGGDLKNELGSQTGRKNKQYDTKHYGKILAPYLRGYFQFVQGLMAMSESGIDLGSLPVNATESDRFAYVRRLIEYMAPFTQAPNKWVTVQAKLPVVNTKAQTGDLFEGLSCLRPVMVSGELEYEIDMPEPVAPIVVPVSGSVLRRHAADYGVKMAQQAQRMKFEQENAEPVSGQRYRFKNPSTHEFLSLPGITTVSGEVVPVEVRSKIRVGAIIEVGGHFYKIIPGSRSKAGGAEVLYVKGVGRTGKDVAIHNLTTLDLIPEQHALLNTSNV